MGPCDSGACVQDHRGRVGKEIFHQQMLKIKTDSLSRPLLAIVSHATDYSNLHHLFPQAKGSVQSPWQLGGDLV